MKQLAIFASGSGTNAENIARLFHQGNRIRVGVVLCNRKECGVYERLEAFGVPVIYMPNSSWDSDPERIIETLRPYNIDMIVLAGFMRAVRPEIIDFAGGRVLNIHPSLLPAYGGKGMYGHHVHEAVIAAGEKKSGVSVHYVTEEIDGGDIVMQQEIEVYPDDTAATLEERIHAVEYDLYPRAIVKALGEIKEPATPPQIPVPHTDDNASASEAGATTPPPAAPTPSRSADEDWAQALHINTYSDKEAERARARAEERRVPPPAGMATPPANSPQAASLLHPAVADALAQGKEVPKSYMWVSILMAVLFSTIPGIVAIIFSASVSSRLSCGDLAGAEKASRNAQAWIIASFVIGVLSATLWVPITLLF